VAMFRLAKLDGENPGLWAGITFALCFGLGMLLGFVMAGGGLIGCGVGALASFGAYFVKKMTSDSYH